MKNFLSLIYLTLLGSMVYANHTLNFNNSSDIMTCKNGSYTISKNSSHDEIVKNCQFVKSTVNQGSKNLPRLVFIADHGAEVTCTLKLDKVDKCIIKD